MSSALEKSLDEIIGSDSRGYNRNRGNRRGSRGNRGGRGGRGGKAGISKPRHRGHGGRAYGAESRPLVNSGKSNEIKITNLHPDLTNEDLTKLMNTIGPTKNVEIKYNTHGQSTGVAIVQYESSEDAMNAIKKFDRRLAAGQIINVSTTMPLIDRIGGPNASSGRRQNKKLAGGKPNRRENKTLEDLDNELNMYMNGEPKSSIQQEQEQEQAQGQEGGQDQQQEQQQISVHDANETIPNSTQDAGELFPVANDIAME